MAIGPKLDLRQTQGLVMTPQLQQAIKLLQLNNMELEAYFEEELEKNPLLERADSGSGDQSNADNDDNEESRRTKEFIESESNLEALQDLGKKQESTKEDYSSETDSSYNEEETDWTGGEYSDIGKGGGLSFDNSEYSLEKTVSEEKNLRDHLQEQLFLTFPEGKKRQIGLALIDRLTPAGYLREQPAEIAEKLNCPLPNLMMVLQTMKEFDPTGIFANDLKECLALQLKEKDRYDPAMQSLVNNLELLGKHDHQKLLELCQVDLDDLRDMITEIRALNPKPASAFEHFVSQTIIPDIIMRPQKTETGEGWSLELNTKTLPKALVNKKYYTEVVKMAHSKEEKTFIDEQLQNANWIVRAMDQRAQTILKVASEIVRQQDAFFAYGLEYLKPLTLREVAEEIEMHESTVSRVTTNKYMGTPRGLFELKYFFNSGVGSVSGKANHSSESVKAKIKVLIDEEPINKPLSDDKLASLLKAEGIDIARRTVAKYREALKIPSSSQRKREKKSCL